MGFMNDLFGANQQSAPIQNIATPDQANQAFGNTQQGLAQQQAFTQALMGQNGIGNQASVFGQQQALANQLQDQANGQGPNPALAQLNQTTSQNIAGQNALMAGQRGASSNAGLIARQAAMQGGNLQQQAVGQAATLGAQQQIAAQNALMGQQANMANLSTQQIGQQQNALQAYNQGAQNQQSNLLGGINAQNQINAGIQAQNAKNNAKFAGMALGSAGSLLSAASGGEVRKDPYTNFGSLATPNQSLPPIDTKGFKPFADGGAVQTPNGPQSFAGQYLRSSIGSGSYTPDTSSGYEDKDLNKSSQGIIDKFKGMGGGAPAIGQTVGAGAGAGASAGMEAGLGAGAATGAEAASLGSMVAEAAPMVAVLNKGGGAFANRKEPVPGKPKKKGDNLENDTVKALLSPGEIVLPRSVTQSNDPINNAAKFVAAIMAKKGRRK